MSESSIAELLRMIAQLDEKLTKHMEGETVQYNALMNKIAELDCKVADITVLFDAFPDTDDGSAKDIHGHRHYHLGKIKDYRESESRWARIKNEVISNVVKGGVTILAVILAFGIHASWLRFVA